MAGYVWKRTPRDARKFNAVCELGRKYYTINNHATNLGAYEDEQTYSVHVFTERSWITRSPICSGQSAEGLVLRFGPVYEDQPKGLRNIAGPAPQVAGPVDSSQIYNLDEPELRGLEKRNRDAANEPKEKGKRKSSWG